MDHIRTPFKYNIEAGNVAQSAKCFHEDLNYIPSSRCSAVCLKRKEDPSTPAGQPAYQFSKPQVKYPASKEKVDSPWGMSHEVTSQFSLVSFTLTHMHTCTHIHTPKLSESIQKQGKVKAEYMKNGNKKGVRSVQWWFPKQSPSCYRKQWNSTNTSLGHEVQKSHLGIWRGKMLVMVSDHRQNKSPNA